MDVRDDEIGGGDRLREALAQVDLHASDFTLPFINERRSLSLGKVPGSNRGIGRGRARGVARVLADAHLQGHQASFEFGNAVEFKQAVEQAQGTLSESDYLFKLEPAASA